MRVEQTTLEVMLEQATDIYSAVIIPARTYVRKTLCFQHMEKWYMIDVQFDRTNKGHEVLVCDSRGLNLTEVEFISVEKERSDSMHASSTGQRGIIVSVRKNGQHISFRAERIEWTSSISVAPLEDDSDGTEIVGSIIT